MWLFVPALVLLLSTCALITRFPASRLLEHAHNRDGQTNVVTFFSRAGVNFTLDQISTRRNRIGEKHTIPGWRGNSGIHFVGISNASDIYLSGYRIKGGNDVLYALNTVANANKHCMLRPMAVVTGAISLHFRKISGGRLGVTDMAWDANKNEIVIARYTKGTYVDYNFKIPLAIAFDPSTLEYGDPVGRFLYGFGVEVERVLASVETEARRLGFVK